MPNFTTEDLILYLYRETSKDQTLAIEKALQSDWTLRDELDALQATGKTLDKVVCSPRRQTIDAILKYARNTAEVAVNP